MGLPFACQKIHMVSADFCSGQ